jgi:Cu/Ag efflux pump CusA
LERIANAAREEKAGIKTDIAVKVAGTITVELLDHVPELKGLVEPALKPVQANGS